MRRRDFIRLIGIAAITGIPSIAPAQRKKIPTVGVLWHAGNAEEEGVLFVALRQGFLDLGYIEGKTLVLDHTYASEQYEQFTANAAALVARNVDVLVAVTRLAAVAAQRATTTIPVVFTVVPDPVGLKLVASLASPGGNITGLTHIATELGAKRIAILKEAFPNISRVALLVNPHDPAVAQRNIEEAQVAAGGLGITVQPIEVRSPTEIANGFALIDAARLEAVVTGVDPMIYNERKHIAALALARRLPSMVHAAPMVDDGNLMSYAPDYPALFKRTTTYVHKILQGEKPSNIPVEQPTKFELVINLKTAHAAGLTISSAVLLRSDRLIE